jgi:hypothetical protein
VSRHPARLVKRASLVALVLVTAAGGGVGGYLLGQSGGEDLEAARTAGLEQGRRTGNANGTRDGYQEGFTKGRRAGYARAYDKAYVRAYRRKFEEVGFPPPKKVKVH